MVHLKLYFEMSWSVMLRAGRVQCWGWSALLLEQYLSKYLGVQCSVRVECNARDGVHCSSNNMLANVWECNALWYGSAMLPNLRVTENNAPSAYVF